MFNPSQDDVRRFFCLTYSKTRQQQILTPLETMASYWIQQHPEYADLLENLEQALTINYVDDQTNPFLHLSMHLSISEQISINQPRGIRAAAEKLIQRQSEHTAHHQMMECLGQMLWDAQRNRLPPDPIAYLACVQKQL